MLRGFRFLADPPTNLVERRERSFDVVLSMPPRRNDGRDESLAGVPTNRHGQTPARIASSLPDINVVMDFTVPCRVDRCNRIDRNDRSDQSGTTGGRPWPRNRPLALLRSLIKSSAKMIAAAVYAERS